VIGKRVKLKNKDLIGTIDKLHLPANKERNRPKDLYKVKWDNGKVGLVEEKDVEKCT
jgi:hypothetical protein